MDKLIFALGGALAFALLVFNALLMASGHFILGIVYFGAFLYLILVVLDKWF